MKYAVDTFCYGMFLFDLVTGKSPSDIDPKTNKLFRDVMLKRSPQEPINEYVDDIVGYDLWAKLLYWFGKECTIEIANQRPKMESVHDALEQLIKGKPQSLEMQVCIFFLNCHFFEGVLSMLIEPTGKRQKRRACFFSQTFSQNRQEGHD